jgi:hypothetical protein
LSKSDESIPLGFHEFFRYAIPAYGFVALALIVFSLNDRRLISSLSLPTAVVGVITGPFIGFLVSTLYYQIWVLYYKRKSKAYKKVKEIIESIPKFGESELGTEYNGEKQLKYLVRFVWDFVYFSDENRATRDRIQFIYTMMHSIGATILAIWLGFFSGVIFPVFLGQEKLMINIKWQWVFLVGVLFVISLLLGSAFRERKILGENEEYLLARENYDKVKGRVSSNMNTPKKH